ncbi:Uncharacterized protein TCAP_00863 [Tolypocladium capitatum]|uniref:Uncharacterized protein n=1 Tax=Tolypocladium capitatum TaxID=45235 RepID=A0A2K3QNW0_9HYPO|nr:Uncharacterized protein TCAP_00863 [Tolypocladium capitatum]
MAASSSPSSLPQGFSVYQHALGAQLQFFPALGSQLLDDLINAYIPGPAAIGEKRADVSVDFLKYAQLTGQTFKFYPASVAASVAASPVTTSPSLDSANSSFNVSPVTPSWDWSAATSVSSRSSTQHQRPSKATTPSSRHRTATDVSSMPGMKILTKDGVDVTNSAPRGSKTKEQRDHAHLMRIIKACDSCRRKKLRCDPSHKKRAAAESSAEPAAAGAGPKPSKRQRTLTQVQSPPLQNRSSAPLAATVVDEFSSFSGLFDLDSFDYPILESLDAAALPSDPWEEFVQFPPMDIAEDYDLLLDPENYFSSQSCALSSSPSPFKVPTPQSQQERGAPAAADNGGDETLQITSPRYPFLDQSGSFGRDYTDFNLFSPKSSFSEDDHMLLISSSSSSLPSSKESLISEYPPPGYDVCCGGDGEVGGWDSSLASAEALRFSTGEDLGVIDYYDPGFERGESSNCVVSSCVEPTPGSAESLGGQVGICCAPGTAVLTREGSSSRVPDNVSTCLGVCGFGLARSAASEPPAIAVRDYVTATVTSAHGQDQPSVNVLYQQDLRMRPASHRSEAVSSYGTESGRQGLDTGGEQVTVSHVASTRGIFFEQPSAESPGLPSTSRGGEARHISLASPAALQTTSVDRLVDYVASRVVTRSPDLNHSATQQYVNVTVPSSAVSSASEGAANLNGLPDVNRVMCSVINSATSSQSHVSDQWSTRTASIDASSLESRLLNMTAVDQQVNAAQTSIESSTCGLALAFVAAAILFMLLIGRELTSALASVYMLGAMLLFAFEATAPAPTTPAPLDTTSRQPKGQSPPIKSNSDHFFENTWSIADLPGRSLAAVLSHVAQVSARTFRAFHVMTWLKW